LQIIDSKLDGLDYTLFSLSVRQAAEKFGHLLILDHQRIQANARPQHFHASDCAMHDTSPPKLPAYADRAHDFA
jgi:hypothetical protein